MRYPGEILAQHKWIVSFSALVVIVGIAPGANRVAYENLIKYGPKISWENVPASAMTLFFWNLRAALLSLFTIGILFFPFPLASGIGLGMSIGIGFWIMTQNLLGIVVYSHGILEIYSAFLALNGGFLIISKIGEAIWGFLRPFTPHYVNWKEVATEYRSLFLFSVIGLFVSAWMEAFLGYTMRYVGHWGLVAIGNTIISLFMVGYFSSSMIRAFVMRKSRHEIVSKERTVQKIPEAEKIPGVWCICPKCGAYISADIEYCTCGTKLPERKPKSSR